MIGLSYGIVFHNRFGGDGGPPAPVEDVFLINAANTEFFFINALNTEKFLIS